MCRAEEMTHTILREDSSSIPSTPIRQFIPACN